MSDYQRLYRHARRHGYGIEQAIDLCDFLLVACGLSFDCAAYDYTLLAIWQPEQSPPADNTGDQ